MRKVIDHLFNSLMDQDTEILEGMSGFAAIWYVILMSKHDVLTMMPSNFSLYVYLFTFSVILGGSCQILAVYNDNHCQRKAGAFGGLLFWSFLAAVAWFHQSGSSGLYGHTGSVAAYFSLALGNALAYVKLGDINANAGS